MVLSDVTKDGRAKVLGVYTLAFAVAAFIAFMPLMVEGKSLINKVDGLSQQFGTFVDMGMTLRGIWADFLAGKGLHVPFYDFSTGYGSARSWSHDPLQYLSFFCSTDNAEWLFNVLVVVRIWLAGACALPLMFRLGTSQRGAVLGALAYAFSGSGLHCAMQTHMLNVMILFPVVAYGALGLLEGERPWPYVFACGGCCFVCGPYLFYMVQLLIAVLVITILAVRRASWRDWLRFFALFIGCTVVSMLMACDRLADIARISSLDRVSVDYPNPLLYSAEYYQRLVCGFAAAASGMVNCRYYGYGACVLLGAIALWMDEPNQRVLVLRALFVAGLVFLCVPFAGSVLNGLSYSTNRWVFGFALLVACIAGTQLERVLAMDVKQLTRLAAVLLAYCALVLIIPYKESVQAHWQMMAAWAVVLFLALRSGKWGSIALRATCVVALGCNWALFFSPMGVNWQGRLLFQGDAYPLAATETPAGLAANSELASTSRTDRSVALAKYSQTPGLLAHRLLDTYGIDFYSSVYNNDVDIFHSEMGLAFSDLPASYFTLDQRAALMRVLGVGTYVTKKGARPLLPYGVQSDSADSLETRLGETFELYEEETPSSLALVYNDVIAQTTYESLTPLQKQEALLQRVVLSDEDAQGRTLGVPELTSEEANFSVLELSDGVKLKNGALVVSKASSYVRLELEHPVSSCEMYLYVKGLAFDAMSPRERYTSMEWNKLTRAQQRKIERSEKTWEEPTTFKIGVKSSVCSNVADIIATPHNDLYGGKDTWLWNAGYSNKTVRRFRLTFYTPGVYTFDDFKVFAQPMDTYDEATERFAAQAVKDLDIADDTLTCSVDASAGQMLFLSIPYDECWHAKVNGVEVDVHKADTAFMAIDLVEGTNEIEFAFKSNARYMTSVGVVTTLVCLVVCFRSRILRR